MFVLYRTLNRIEYARTVKNGDKALTVWTVATGILEVAMLENKCPVSTNKLMGAVLFQTCKSGRRTGAVPSQPSWKALPTCARSPVHAATKKNCTIVKVAGASITFRNVFDEVFVRAEDEYQRTHKATNLSIGEAVYPSDSTSNAFWK